MRRLLIIAGLLGFAISAYAQGDAPGGRLGTRDAQEAIRRASAEPTSRLPDGTPNLGRVGTEKGIWGLPGLAGNSQLRASGGWRARKTRPTIGRARNRRRSKRAVDSFSAVGGCCLQLQHDERFEV